MIENVMERIAYNLGKDPIQVRMLNMNKEEENPIPDMIEQLKKDSNYDERMPDIQKFNKENRWRKRALKIMPMTYDLFYFGTFACTVSIYHADGSVAITHGAVEMGQGINTKIAQVCGHLLGVPIDKISVKPTSSFVIPNIIATGGSIGSECVSFAAVKACGILNERLDPIKKKMKNANWNDIIVEAFGSGINLQASYMYSPNDGVKPYDIYGVVTMEVEVDILTGNHEIRRVDLLEDVGQSLSPEIDVGQVRLLMG